MAAASLATSVPRNTHSHTYVGLAKRRRIIHAVAQHRHDFAARLQPPNQHQLVFGCNAAESRNVSEDDAELLRGESVKLARVENLMAIVHEIQLTSDS